MSIPVFYEANGQYRRGWVRDGSSTTPPASLAVFDDPGCSHKVGEYAVFRANTAAVLSRADDLTSLAYLEEPNMLNCLGERYKEDKIYTGIAGVLVAVNPYKTLPDLYSATTMDHYKTAPTLTLAKPHVFCIAERARRAQVRSAKNQSIICCGESGSGKTESTKWLMRCLTSSTTNSAPGALNVLALNPVTEAFGNAKTLRNNNSSRFAKFIKLFTSQEGHITGCHLETYLLERSRVTDAPAGERNYHVFYYLCAKPEKRWGLPSASKLHYLGGSAATTRPVNIAGVDDAKEYGDLVRCLESLDVNTKPLFDAVAGILHVGQIECSEKGRTGARTKKALEYGSKLLGVSKDALEKSVLTRNMHVGGETINKTLGGSEASANRDAIAKALYNGLFEFLVGCVNTRGLNGANTKASNESGGWIGILDVFGFESFERNSYEQFCINFANERLQDFFNNHILKSEQEEYRREAIRWDDIVVRDNSDTIALLAGGGTSVFALLDSACIVPNGSPSTFVDSVMTVHGGHRSLARPGFKSRVVGFRIKHYAEEVLYDVSEFLTKNDDSLHPDVLAVFANSSNSTIKAVFSKQDSGGGRRVAAQRFKSIGKQFTGQLRSLVTMLESTQPYFVRCLNPNNVQKPNKYDSQYVGPQARAGGLVETLRMLKYGYPFRVPYTLVTTSYLPKLGLSSQRQENVKTRNLCEAILVAFSANGAAGIEDLYQLGLTKIFFRSGQQDLLERIEDYAAQDSLPDAFRASVHRWLLKCRMRCLRGCARSAGRVAVRLRRLRAVYRLRATVRIIVSLSRAVRVSREAIAKRNLARHTARNATQQQPQPVKQNPFRNRELESNLRVAKAETETLSREVSKLKVENTEALRRIEALAAQREQQCKEYEESRKRQEDAYSAYCSKTNQSLERVSEEKAALAREMELLEEKHQQSIERFALQERELIQALGEKRDELTHKAQEADQHVVKIRTLEEALEKQRAEYEALQLRFQQQRENDAKAHEQFNLRLQEQEKALHHEATRANEFQHQLRMKERASEVADQDRDAATAELRKQLETAYKVIQHLRAQNEQSQVIIKDLKEKLDTQTQQHEHEKVEWSNIIARSRRSKRS